MTGREKYLQEFREQLRKNGISNETVSGLSWSDYISDETALEELISFWAEVPGMSFRSFYCPEVNMYLMAIWVAPKA